MIWIEFCILLVCILIGARLGGIALGTIAGIGLAIFVFGFAMPPGTVIGMIIAVITALAAMQAAGGLDYLVSVAEKVMRRHAKYITFVAPLATYLLVPASGTAAIISIIGVSWLGSSFFEGNRDTIVSGISAVVGTHPWAFGAGLFILSCMLF
jgi:anaerobic C4-dicarboxylate transporter